MPFNPFVPRVSSCRRHMPSGQALVTLNGRASIWASYLGEWNTRASGTECARPIGEWLAGVCILRPCDVDNSADVWTCRLESH